MIKKFHLKQKRPQRGVLISYVNYSSFFDELVEVVSLAVGFESLSLVFGVDSLSRSFSL